jgi:hypothetical protein
MVENTVDLLINDIEQDPAQRGILPEIIQEKIAGSPQLTVEFFKRLLDWQRPLSDKRTNILFALLDEGLHVIRYATDRQDANSAALQQSIQGFISKQRYKLPNDLRMKVNQIVFDSKLSFEIDDDEQEISAPLVNQADITPRLPELLEQLRRDKVFRNAFELYEIMLPQIHLESASVQLALIAELAHAKKAIAHEVAVLMLLHPKVIIRQKVASLLYQLGDENLFTPVDLRRLIMIRNWVPTQERTDIDALIKHLRMNNLPPAPYTESKVSTLVGSSMDGAGVACIMMETKQKNQRQAAGFLVKLGVGIRDPWVMNKAPKDYIDNVLAQQVESGGLPSKSVSKSYVNKLVQHFLSVSVKSGVVPEPLFIQIAEILGADNWRPQALLFTEELARLREKYADLLNDGSIGHAIDRSGRWYPSNSLISSWFETGDHAHNAIIESSKTHERNPALSIEAVTTDCLMAKCLDKWQMIFLLTCLWMRTKDIDERGFDLVAILHKLDQNVSPSEIPLLCNMTVQTMAYVFRRG